MDSSSEGPLEWVKIGIPNEYAQDFTALSASINKISYYGSGGDYVRLNLDRSYYAGEVVELDFKFRQHNMYEKKTSGFIASDSGEEMRFYSFTPGWFDEIEVESLKIYWDSKNVLGINGQNWKHEKTELFDQ